MPDIKPEVAAECDVCLALELLKCSGLSGLWAHTDDGVKFNEASEVEIEGPLAFFRSR